MEKNNQSQQKSHSTPLLVREGQGEGLFSLVQLWRMLERTEEILHASYKRFCPRNILKLWHAQGIFKPSPKRGGLERALEEAIFDVCILCELEGYEELPTVRLYPRKHREFLRAIIAVTQGIGMRKVDTHALDRAFSQAFPHATCITVNKKKLQ